jgi:aspartyl-tRNA(Asn)/glutamyl-tRNA(Gln) amidotransferase subunit A
MKVNSLAETVRLIRSREVSSQDLVKELLERATKLDRLTNAFITINPSVLEEAREKDNLPVKGRLHGIPIVFKDNFVTKGIRTTAGSKVLDDFVPQYNATVVQRLLDEGAIIFGKNNMDAWAHGSSTETSDYGPSRNPWNFEHLPGGSSGGTAATVVLDMAICGIGSETAGSIRQPAAWSGCVGLKPTYGRVSRYGLIAMASSLDCPGPIAKTVEDAAIILEIIAGQDKYDATTSPAEVEKYTSFLGRDIKGMRIGLVREYLVEEMHKGVKRLILNAAKVFENLGANVEYVSAMDPHYAIGVYTIIQRSEVSSNLARYDGIRYGFGRDRFGEEAKRRIILGTFALSEGYSERYYKKAMKVRSLYVEDFAKIFQRFDLLIGPTSPTPAKKIGASKGESMFGEIEDMLIEPSTIAGLPGISVPCGFIDGLPVGLNIFGPQFSETRLIQAAHAYQMATGWHLLKPKVDV